VEKQVEIQQGIISFILQCTGLLLGNDLETNNETTFGTRQQIFNKQVYVAATG
jgi:hypothetical protein